MTTLAMALQMEHHAYITCLALRDVIRDVHRPTSQMTTLVMALQMGRHVSITDVAIRDVGLMWH